MFTQQCHEVKYGHFVVVVVLAALCCMWNRSALTRDRTSAPSVEMQSPNHWTSREVPKYSR